MTVMLRKACKKAIFMCVAAMMTMVVAATADARKKTSRAPAKTSAPANSRTSAAVKAEKQKNQAEIKATKNKLSDNERRTNEQLNKLEILSGQISAQESTIADLNATISELESRQSELTDSIAALRDNVAGLRAEVARQMRARRAQRYKVNPLGFVLSSSSFTEARRRLNYLRQLSRGHSRAIRELRAATDTLAARRTEMAELARQQSGAVSRLTAAKTVLDSRKAESARVMSDLRHEQASLQRVLAQKRERDRQLDNELNRLIDEESRRNKNRTNTPAKPSGSAGKPSASQSSQASAEAEEDRKLTGSFESNKGKLLFPVAGTYTIVSQFGRSNYDNLDNVEMNNNGIDIAVAPVTAVRAVFDGEVSSVFFLPGYENIVIIRHGEYLTVYAGLENISVSKDAKVKGGATIGRVAEINGRNVLHFEVRKERTKLNPLEWVK